MQVQPQLILLQKTLFNIEGLGRQLYPELDLWKTAQPVLRAWMRERVGVRTLLKEIRRHLPDALMTLRQVPQVLNTAVREAAQGKALRVDPQSLAELRESRRRADLRRETAAAAGVLWLCGLIWLAVGAHWPWLGWLQLCAGILLFIKARSIRWRIG
jgi:ubiquinone biosynthesis protein